MEKKTFMGLMSLYASFAGLSNPDEHHYVTERKIKGFTAKSTEQIKKERGLTKFTYEDGFETWAINAKNADRKHQNYLKNK
jgi:hypothetical protein